MSRLTSPGRHGADQLARRAARQHGERHLGADRLHADQQQEEVALLLGGEAVERQRVVAHDQVAEQRHRPADRGDVLERLGRHREAVADARRGLEHDVVGPADGDLARDQRDHRAPAMACASGAWLTWQTPTASASVAWSGSGSSGSPSTAQTIRATWSLAARPVPQTACLTCWGV